MTNPQPTTADLMACIADNARSLADAIRAAQRMGIAVTIGYDRDHGLKIVYAF